MSAPAPAAPRRTPAASVRALWDDPSSQLLLAQLAAAGTAFVVNVLAARALDPSGRGELALALQVAYLTTLLLLLGTDRSLVTTYAGASARAGLAGAWSLLRVPAAVALVLVAAGALAPLPPLWRTGMLVVAAFAVANAGLRALRSIAIASGRQHGFLVTTLVSQGALLVVAAGLFVGGVDEVVVWVAGYVLVTAVPVAFCWRRWARAPRRGGRGPDDGADGGADDDADDGADDWASVARTAARREGLVLLPSSLALAGTLRLDRLLLVGLASPAALGVYASVATMTELVAWPVQAWADSRLGRWRLAHQRGELLLLRPLVVTAGFLAVAGVAVAVAVHVVLVPLLGAAYASAGELVAPLVVAAAVFGLSQLAITGLIAQGRAGVASGVEVAGFVVSVAAYVMLIPALGGLGAAYGSLAGYGASLLGALVALAAGPRDRLAAAARAPRRPTPIRPRRPALLAPLLALLLVAYAGRYGLDRAGLGDALPPSLAALDLRVLALPLLVALVVHEVGRRPPSVVTVRPGERVREGWVVAAVVFFLYQLGSALWAPDGSRVGAVSLDVAATGVLTVSAYLLARGHGWRTGRATLWFLWVAACAYAAAALLAGPGDQGRFSAFGGGPNVFVRVEVLGLVALAGLLATGAPRWLAASIPLLAVAALLSGSRGGLVAAAVVAAVALVALGRRVRAAVVVTGALAVAGAVAATSLFPPFAALVSTRFVEQTLQGGYTSGRPQIWAAALGLAADHPLLGVGLDGFYGSVGEGLAAQHPHNVVLAVLAEGGLVGLAVLGVAAAGWVAAVRAHRPWGPVTATLVAAAGYVVVASAFSGDYYDARLAWCFAALAAGGLVAELPARSTAPSGHGPRSARPGTLERPGP